MNAPLNDAPGPRHFPVIRLIVATVFVNFFLAIVVSRTINQGPIPVLLIAMYGLVTAEWGLVSLWAVLGPQRFGPRWFASLLTLGEFAFAWTVGFATSTRFASEFRGLLALPLVFTVAQFPLWLLRLTTGWRIVRSGTEEETDTRETRQFGVQDLLALTAAVALMLGLARLSVPSTPNAHIDAMSMMWGVVVSVGLVLAVVNTFLLPACVWTGLRVRELSTAVAGLAGYGLLLFLLIGVILALLSQGSGSSDAGAWILLFLAISLGLMFGVLRWAHACGYVLVTSWPKERPTEVPEETEAVESREKTADEPPPQDTVDSPPP